MKPFPLFVSALLLFSVAFSQNCIDSSQINLSALCNFIYDPVCGCDGNTYGNDCDAYYYHGVTSWTPGECQGAGQCVATFTYKPDTVGSGVSFTNLSIGGNLQYAWDFGDSATSAQQDPYHVYNTSAGSIFHACLTVTDTAIGCTDTYCEYVFLSQDCIDNSLIDSLMGCPDVWDPVCGCDGVTYGNSCDAMYYAGVSSWTQGECFPNWGCYAYFSYYSDPAHPFDVYFIGPSFGFIQNMFWDFGDGATSTDEMPVHTYSSTGIYEVCVTVTDTVANCSETYCEHIYVGSFLCIDSVIIDTSMGCPRIYDPVCGCDGVTYGNSCEALYWHGVTSYYPGECWNVQCMAYFWYDYDTGFRHIQFWDMSSGPNSPGNVSGWLWDFGDGNTSTDQNPYHVFADTTQDEFWVCLTVFDTVNACTDTYCEYAYTKEIIWNPCGINFAWDVDSATGVVVFADPGDNDTTINFFWDFGDGTVSSDPNPAHGYSEEGYYYPCVTVYGPDSDSCVFCDTIYAMAERLTSVADAGAVSLQLSIYPNPVKDEAVVRYVLPANANVTISAMDVLGRSIILLQNSDQPQGTHNFILNASALSEGVYMVEILAGGKREVFRVSVMR